MKRLTEFIITLGFSAIMLMGCKSKSEKLVASYLKDYEVAIVKVENLKKMLLQEKQASRMHSQNG